METTRILLHTYVMYIYCVRVFVFLTLISELYFYLLVLSLAVDWYQDLYKLGTTNESFELWPCFSITLEKYVRNNRIRLKYGVVRVLEF